MRFARVFCGILGLSFAFTLAAHANPITVSESLFSDGSLNGVAFTNQHIVISGTGDTTSVTTNSGGTLYRLVLIAPTVTIGSGAAIALTGTYTAFSENTLVGITGPSGNIMDTFSSLPIFNLASSISITGDAINNPGSSFGTAAGAFIISDLDPTNSTFSTVVTAAAAPEPNSLLLLFTGIASAAACAYLSQSARRRTARICT